MMNRDDYIQEVAALRVSPQLRARIAAQEDRAKRGYLRSALRLAVTAACVAALLFAAGVLWDLTHQGGSRNPALTNPPVQHTPTPSPTKDPVPEGLIASDVNAPPQVLTAAVAFVRERFNWWSTHSGTFWCLRGHNVPVGEPAEYDLWRVTALDREWENDRLVGYGTVSAYRVSWGLHTTTPERAREICTGEMYLDEGDWLIPSSEDLLLFLETDDGNIQYLTSIQAEHHLDTLSFKGDVIRAIADFLPTPEGSISEGLDFPQEVLDCAAEVAQNAFAWEFEHRSFNTYSSGSDAPFYYPSEDYVYHEGMEAVQSPLLLDNWRIVDISPKFESADMIDGATVVFYGVTYEYHTSMPALPDISDENTDADLGAPYYAGDGWYFQPSSSMNDHRGVLCLLWDSGELEVVGRYGASDWITTPYQENSLREHIERYLAEKENPTPTPTPSPTPRPLPEGMLDEGIIAIAPAEGLVQAVSWVKDRFAAVCEEAESQSVEFDNWRINSVEKCWKSEADVEVYRVGYAFHTSTPDRVVLTGDARLDEGGWYFENLDYYLLCVRFSGGLSYVTDCRITDCAPGEEAFAQQVREAMLASPYGSAYLCSTIPGITIGVPFEELPESLRSILNPKGKSWRGGPDGTISDAVHKVNICRRYVAPGIEVITSRIAPEKLKKLLQDYDEESLMDAFGVRTRQEAYELEVDREYVHTVILTGPEYATNAGQRVGDTVDTEDPNTYLHGGIGMETSVHISVKDGVITEIRIWDWLGRRVGRFWDP